jgi:hypothetical protein
MKKEVTNTKSIKINSPTNSFPSSKKKKRIAAMNPTEIVK